MDPNAGQNVSEPHLRKSRWRTVLVLSLFAAFLICFALLLQRPPPNPPGFSFGPRLPPGKVTPQLSYNYGNARALICSDGSLWRWETVPNWNISSPIPSEPQRLGSESKWTQVS